MLPARGHALQTSLDNIDYRDGDGWSLLCSVVQLLLQGGQTALVLCHITHPAIISEQMSVWLKRLLLVNDTTTLERVRESLAFRAFTNAISKCRDKI